MTSPLHQPQRYKPVRGRRLNLSFRGRRRPVSSAATGERWLISYADLTTLLFALFVVLFVAGMGRGHQQVKEISRAVEQAFAVAQTQPVPTVKAKVEHPSSAVPVAAAPIATEAHAVSNPMETSLALLAKELQGEIDSGKVAMHLNKEGLVISLSAVAFFQSGADSVQPAIVPTVGKLASILNGLPNRLRLEGHTDSVPIQNSRFRSNWELSAARSISMLRLLTGEFQVDPQRISIAGYADTAAPEAERTEEQRSHNRRVDIVILND